METCLYNSQSDNIVAWCNYHNCGMTVKQMRCKECLQKQCRYLKKNEGHQFWVQHNLKKQKRRARKERLNMIFSERE